MGDGIIEDVVPEEIEQACIEPEQGPVGDAVEIIEEESEGDTSL